MQAFARSASGIDPAGPDLDRFAGDVAPALDGVEGRDGGLAKINNPSRLEDDASILAHHEPTATRARPMP